jgi:hypothetical protein
MSGPGSVASIVKHSPNLSTVRVMPAIIKARWPDFSKSHLCFSFAFGT